MGFADHDAARDYRSPGGERGRFVPEPSPLDRRARLPAVRLMEWAHARDWPRVVLGLGVTDPAEVAVVGLFADRPGNGDGAAAMDALCAAADRLGVRLHLVPGGGEGGRTRRDVVRFYARFGYAGRGLRLERLPRGLLAAPAAGGARASEPEPAP